MLIICDFKWKSSLEVIFGRYMAANSNLTPLGGSCLVREPATTDVARSICRNIKKID